VGTQNQYLSLQRNYGVFRKARNTSFSVGTQNQYFSLQRRLNLTGRPGNAEDKHLQVATPVSTLTEVFLFCIFADSLLFQQLLSAFNFTLLYFIYLFFWLRKILPLSKRAIGLGLKRWSWAHEQHQIRSRQQHLGLNYWPM
jgi:hypothetical protein